MAQNGSTSGKSAPMYAAAPRIYPQSVSGTFRNIKWVLLVVTMGIYYLLPFLRWDRGEAAPDQAVLVDIPGRRLYFFFIEIWPQEVYYLTGLLIIAAMVLFLMNAVAGRLWCGYLCWQTVWTDLFMLVERWVEGDRRGMMKLDKEGFSFRKARLKVTKHALWLLIAWWTGGAWVLYFGDAPTIVWELLHFSASFDVYLWIAILTGATYLFAGWAREQICIYMCPWPRIQAALTDDEALNVTYIYERGEPRGSIKKKLDGDCIDCNQCVNVCPTGTDIRDGLQLSCIQCGICIDACDAIMGKIGKPSGLIAYESEVNIERLDAGLEVQKAKPVRPRTIIYAVMIILVTAIMLWTYLNRAHSGVNVLHDRNPLFVNLSAGGVRNGYTVRILNKKLQPHSFILKASGIDGMTMKVIGNQPDASGQYLIKLSADTTLELRVLLFSPSGVKLPRSSDIVFSITDPASDETATANDYFRTSGR